FGKMLTFEPAVVIYNGTFLIENLKQIRYSIDNVLMMLRENDVFDVSEVELAIIEANGTLTVHKKADKKPLTREDANVTSSHSELALPVIIDGYLYKDVITHLEVSEEWVYQQLEELGVPRIEDVFFASLIDSQDIAEAHSAVFEAAQLTSDVFLDVNNGMDRSGHPLDASILDLYKKLHSLPHLQCHGLHVYDGHIRATDFEARKAEVEGGFVDVEHFLEAISDSNLPKPLVVAGGTPSFTVHALHGGTYCSPGTCVLWDWGYGDKLSEQPFEYAALVLTRVISKPQKGLITVDMGHKSVAAENPIDRRIRFLNLENYELIGQSEEHGVIKVEDWDSIQVGQVLYGVPYHVCPTVNLYDEAYVIENQESTGRWEVLGRKRRITV
ncbi:MAG: YetF domain-containing protein, partial [Runella zeae]